jgi:hypothetical protein
MENNQYYASTLIKPKQWRAGYEGKEQKPFYFNCCKCKAHEPKIAGFYTAKPDTEFTNIITIKNQDGFYSLALYCETCWQSEMANTTLGPIINS